MADQYAMDTDFSDGSKGRIEGVSRPELWLALVGTVDALEFDRITITRSEVSGA